MKSNDIKALHEKTADELRTQLAELRAELAQVQVEKKANKVANPRRVSTLRTDIARINTVLTEKK